MMAEVSLISGEATLILQSGDKDWTNVILVLDGERHILGADLLDKIATRLLVASKAPTS